MHEVSQPVRVYGKCGVCGGGGKCWPMFERMLYGAGLRLELSLSHNMFEYRTYKYIYNRLSQHMIRNFIRMHIVCMYVLTHT